MRALGVTQRGISTTSIRRIKKSLTLIGLTRRDLKAKKMGPLKRLPSPSPSPKEANLRKFPTWRTMAHLNTISSIIMKRWCWVRFLRVKVMSLKIRISRNSSRSLIDHTKSQIKFCKIRVFKVSRKFSFKFLKMFESRPK